MSCSRSNPIPVSIGSHLAPLMEGRVAFPLLLEAPPGAGPAPPAAPPASGPPRRKQHLFVCDYVRGGRPAAVAGHRWAT